eukprot:g12004.t1
MFTCTSANMVYCIRCSRCDLFYIGEAKRRLGDCFVEHLRLVCNKRQHLPVANHFSSPSHSLDDATRKLEEQHLIFRHGTLQP